MHEQTNSRLDSDPLASEDLSALYKIYGAMKIEYVNVVRMEHINRVFERWSLLAECRNQTQQRD
ncbi:cellulose biosynthesis protein BcsR [Edwardsiella tarda]